MEGEEHEFGASLPAALLAAEDCLSDKLGLWLRVAQKAFVEVVNTDFHRFRVTQLDFLVLSLIASHPGCRQSAIAQRLGIKSPNLAAAIDYLVQRGYVDKTADTVDRRANHLTLTDRGSAFIEQLSCRYAELTRSFFPGSQGDLQHRAAVAMLRLIARRQYMAGAAASGPFAPGRSQPADFSEAEHQGAD